MLRIFISNAHRVVHIVYICCKTYCAFVSSAHCVFVSCAHCVLVANYIVYLLQTHCVFESCAHCVFVAKHIVHLLQRTLCICYTFKFMCTPINDHPCIPYHSEESFPVVWKNDRLTLRDDGTLRRV